MGWNPWWPSLLREAERRLGQDVYEGRTGRGGEERRGQGRGGEGSVVKYLAAPLEDLSLITSTQNQ